MDLRTKFSIGVVALVALIVTGIGAMTVVSERQLLLSEMDRQHAQLTKRLARICEESLYQSELILFNYLKGLSAERGFVEACFVDKNGSIQMHSDPKRNGSPFNSSHPMNAIDSEGVYVSRYALEDGRPVVDFSAPVGFGTNVVGTAHLLLSQEVLKDFIAQSLKTTLHRMVAISLAALVIGLAGAFLLAKTLVAPIRTVVEGMRGVAHGRLDPLPSLNRQDELGWMMEELNLTINKLKELDEMKREFSASVTHELRSPLTAIDRFVALLLKGNYGPLSNEQRESLITVQNNTVRLSRFVDDLLTAAKIESRRIDVFRERFDIRTAINEVVKLYLPLFQEKSIRLSVDAPPVPLTVYADRGKTVQILSNLISNALKFTAKGSVEIQTSDQPKLVRITVADTGAGISPADREHLFEKFFRSSSTAHQTKGTGLGLSIVKGFLEAQQGTIDVQPNPGGGSRFVFTLPKPNGEFSQK